MGFANATMDLFDDSFHLLEWDTSLVWDEKQSSVQNIVYQSIPSCSIFYFHSQASILEHGPISQVVRSKGYLRVLGLILGNVHCRSMNRRVGNYGHLHMAQI